MTPVICTADESHAQGVHEIVKAIPWISEATKSSDGFSKMRESCARGEVFIIVMNSRIASIMILRKDDLAASLGYNIWSIPLIVTVEEQRRRGHARRLVRKAKQIIGHGVIKPT
jgi:hypothetical protein